MFRDGSCRTMVRFLLTRSNSDTNPKVEAVPVADAEPKISTLLPSRDQLAGRKQSLHTTSATPVRTAATSRGASHFSPASGEYVRVVNATLAPSGLMSGQASGPDPPVSTWSEPRAKFLIQMRGLPPLEER